VPLFLGRGSDPVILARRFNVGRMSVTGASRGSDGWYWSARSTVATAT